VAETYKSLGQAIPAAATLTTLYTVPAATNTVCSTIKACNQSTATTIRVSIAVAGAADATKQYVYYDLPLAANDTYSATEGWALQATDVVRCQSASGNVSFNLFGVENA
jgi:hypothetical protein